MYWKYLFIIGLPAAVNLAHSINLNTGSHGINRRDKLANPAISPSLGYLAENLTQHLDFPAWKIQEWDPGYIPAACAVQLAAHRNLSATDIEVYNVTYEDCSAPWIMCRHEESPSPIATIVESFGRVPVGLRQHVRHVMTVPDHSKTGWLAYQYKGSLIFMNSNDDKIEVVMHETGHAVDAYCGYNVPGHQNFSSTPEWEEAAKKDPKVATFHATSNLSEDLAETTVLAAYDVNVPGGIQGALEEWQDVHTQYTTVQKHLGDKLKSGGRCTMRLTDSAMVRVGETHIDDALEDDPTTGYNIHG